MCMSEVVMVLCGCDESQLVPHRMVSSVMFNEIKKKMQCYCKLLVSFLKEFK